MAISETILGVLAQNQPLPAGLDGNRIALWALRSGNTYESVRAMLGAGLQEYNAQMLVAWGDMITVTKDTFLMYPNGGSIEPAVMLSGGARVPLVRGFNAGHMVDLQVWGIGIGGTWREFADMTESVLIASVRGIVTALRNNFDKAMLTRFFNNTDNALGTSGNTPAGYDAPFCNGSPLRASGGPDYAPPNWNGQTFQDTHNHYIAENSSSGKTWDNLLSDLAQLINEHGLAADYKVYMSDGADVGTVSALTEFVKPVDDINWADRGGSTSGAQYFESVGLGAVPATGGRYVGSYRTNYGLARLWATPRVPTGYAGLYKPNSELSPLNALAVRYRPEFGLGCRIVEIPDFNTTFPLKEVDVELEYGVSCSSNRYMGAAGQIGAGVSSYSNPTIN